MNTDTLSTAYTAEQVDGLIYAIGHAAEGHAGPQGVVVVEREPGSDHGWIEVFPAGPGARYAIWKHTGAVHSIDHHGAVSDDPVWQPNVIPGRPPLLKVIFVELKRRGWQLQDGAYVDPEGNRHGTLEAAVAAQSFREIAQIGAPGE